MCFFASTFFLFNPVEWLLFNFFCCAEWTFMLTHLNFLTSRILKVLSFAFPFVIFQLGHIPDKERRSTRLHSPWWGPWHKFINQRLLRAPLAILTDRLMICIKALITLVSENVGQVREWLVVGGQGKSEVSFLNLLSLRWTKSVDTVIDLIHSWVNGVVFGVQ